MSGLSQHEDTPGTPLKKECHAVPAIGTLPIAGSFARIGPFEMRCAMAGDTLRGLERGLLVLDALSVSSGLTLRELHRNTSLPKPTLLRILATLETHGYVRRRIADGVWRCRARRPDKGSLEGLLLDAGSDILGELCCRLRWPSDLAVYDAGSMTIVETTRRKTPYAVNWTGIGYRVPMLQTGLGRAWLSYCSDEEREDILASLRASESPFDRAANNAQLVEQLIAETRQQGYGTRVAGFTLRKAGEEKSDGFAVPVMSRNRIVGCINLIWLVAALDLPTAIARYLPEVQAAADMIGSEIDARLALNSAQATDLQ
ncbi:MAG TPA: helix-turn-helix domain-containing protein [Xanthobacteraceae bacterium]|nr:helix-turn-helix domain-containing protein [Xanthobacteraceae bacterium]